MDVAGAVEKHIERAEFGGKAPDRRRIGHIQPGHANAGRPVIAREEIFAQVGGHDQGTLAGHRQRARMADALTGGSHENALSLQSVHAISSGRTTGRLAGGVYFRRAAGSGIW